VSDMGTGPVQCIALVLVMVTLILFTGRSMLRWAIQLAEVSPRWRDLRFCMLAAAIPHTPTPSLVQISSFFSRMTSY
jgi:hypothetical protein